MKEKTKTPSPLTGSEAERRAVIIDAIAQAHSVLSLFEDERQAAAYAAKARAAQTNPPE
jgi:hypothetical protein